MAHTVALRPATSVVDRLITALGFNTLREKVAGLLSYDERKLNDLGLTRFEVEQIADVPFGYESVRASTVLTAYVHGEVSGRVR